MCQGSPFVASSGNAGKQPKRFLYSSCRNNRRIADVRQNRQKAAFSEENNPKFSVFDLGGIDYLHFGREGLPPLDVDERGLWRLMFDYNWKFPKKDSNLLVLNVQARCFRGIGFAVRTVGKTPC